MTGPLVLNGYRLTCSADTFTVHTAELHAPKLLRGLREQHPDWHLYRRDTTIYGLPKNDHPSTSFGTPTTVATKDFLHLIANRLTDLLPERFPEYQAFRRHPLRLLANKGELIGNIARQLNNPPAILNEFTVTPSFELEPKIIEPNPDEILLALFINLKTRWEVRAKLQALRQAGVNLTGLYVVSNNQDPAERRLLGKIQRIEGEQLSQKRDQVNQQRSPQATRSWKEAKPTSPTSSNTSSASTTENSKNDSDENNENDSPHTTHAPIPSRQPQRVAPRPTLAVRHHPNPHRGEHH